MSATPQKPAVSGKSAVTSGVIWGVGGALFYQAVALFVQTALTHFLSKPDYGSYAKAFALLSFAMLMQQVGFNEVLLRKRQRWTRWLGSALWLAMLLGVAGAMVLLLIARPLGELYEDELLTELLWLAAPLPLVRSLIVVPAATLVAGMRFRVHYGMMVVNGLATSLLTLLLAWQGWGAHSFPVSMLVVEPLTAIALWRSSRPHLDMGPAHRRWPSMLARWRRLLADLRFTLGGNVSRWLRSGMDALILGIFAGPAVVGVYFFGQSLVVQIVRVITLNASGVLLPALNRLSDDPPRQVQAFMQAARVLMFVGAPACIGLGVVGALFVRVFLDAGKWHDLPPVLGILAFGVVFRLLDEPVNALLNAQGRFRLGFGISAIAGAAYGALCLLGASTGTAIGMSISAAVFFVIAGPLVLFITIKRTGGTYLEALRLFAIPTALALVTIVPWLMLDAVLPGAGRVRDAIVLTATIAAAALTYLLMARVLRPPGWPQLLERLLAMMPLRLKPLVAQLTGTR